MVLVIKIVLATIFGLAALTKFLGKSKDKSGYGLPFMYAVAVAEILLSAALFTPYDVWAAVGLLGILIGALVTLVREQVAPTRYGMAVFSLILVYAFLALKIFPDL